MFYKGICVIIFYLQIIKYYKFDGGYFEVIDEVRGGFFSYVGYYIN